MSSNIPSTPPRKRSKKSPLGTPKDQGIVPTTPSTAATVIDDAFSPFHSSTPIKAKTPPKRKTSHKSKTPPTVYANRKTGNPIFRMGPNGTLPTIVTTTDALQETYYDEHGKKIPERDLPKTLLNKRRKHGEHSEHGGKSKKSNKKMKRITRKQKRNPKRTITIKTTRKSKKNKEGGGEGGKIELPTCKGIPYTTDNTPYADPNHIIGDEDTQYEETYKKKEVKDWSKILIELKDIDKEVWKDFIDNCYLYSAYIKFWNENKKEIIAAYNLGPKYFPLNQRRRVLTYLVKIHKGEQLTKSLEIKLDKIMNESKIKDPQNPNNMISLNSITVPIDTPIQSPSHTPSHTFVNNPKNMGRESDAQRISISEPLVAEPVSNSIPIPIPISNEPIELEGY